jgi:hypothetical protein
MRVRLPVGSTMREHDALVGRTTESGVAVRTIIVGAA